MASARIAWPGRWARCANTEGMGVHRPGFFAEYATADHRRLFSVDGLESDTAVFAEHCLRDAWPRNARHPSRRQRVGDRCRTYWAAARSQLIRSGGTTSVTAADIVPFKLETAAALGVDSTVRLDGESSALTQGAAMAKRCQLRDVALSPIDRPT